MKFKKLLSITLLTIPLYFFTPNTSKSEELKINLENPEIKTEQTDQTKTGNIFNDLDTKIFIQNAEEFAQRAGSKIEQKVYEKHFLLEISPETRYFLFNWENATRFMNDMEKKLYTDKVNDDFKRIIKKEFKNEAQQEFKESKFYEWLKDELTYYKKKVKGNLRGEIKVHEEEAYIDDEGGINFGYKKEKFTNIPKEEGFKICFRNSDISVEHKDYFEFRLKTKPFSFHSWDYAPRLGLDLITKYVSIHGKTSYEFVDKKLKTSITAVLPEGFALSMDYKKDDKKDNASFTTSLSKKIKDYNLNLGYTKTHDDKTSSGSGTIMFGLEKTW